MPRIKSIVIRVEIDHALKAHNCQANSALRYAPVELKLLILFAMAVLSLSLARPIPGILPQPQWELLSFPGHGNRYFFLPSISFLAALAWIALAHQRYLAGLRSRAFTVAAWNRA